jgi:putative PIN family toxin of toxin-antitoxin system
MIWGGLPAKIVEKAEDKTILIIVSEEIIREISRTLSYPRLREIFGSVDISREELLEAVLRIGKVVDVKTRANVVHEDPTDNKFLECALDGDADYVVSSNEHLLKMKCYQKIRIVPVRKFLKLLGNPKSHSSKV